MTRAKSPVLASMGRGSSGNGAQPPNVAPPLTLPTEQLPRNCRQELPDYADSSSSAAASCRRSKSPVKEWLLEKWITSLPLPLGLLTISTSVPS